jgi:hypothetical protein
MANMDECFKAVAYYRTLSKFIDDDEVYDDEVKLPFIDELLSLNDKNVRKMRAKELCARYATLRTSKGKPNGFEMVKHHLNRWGGFACSNDVHSVFGGFVDSWNEYYDRRVLWWSSLAKNGIEVLNARPNATGHTYSNQCLITVKELKEACKANGIKATGDKKALLNSLMKL